MRIIQREAVQAHAVPKRVYEARGPFPLYQPEIVGISHDPDWFPPGATAQNGMQEVIMYECSRCLAVVRGDALETHQCEE